MFNIRLATALVGPIWLWLTSTQGPHPHREDIIWITKQSLAAVGKHYLSINWCCALFNNNNNNRRLVTLAEHTSDHGRQTNSSTEEKCSVSMPIIKQGCCEHMLKLLLYSLVVNGMAPCPGPCPYDLLSGLCPHDPLPGPRPVILPSSLWQWQWGASPRGN